MVTGNIAGARGDACTAAQVAVGAGSRRMPCWLRGEHGPTLQSGCWDRMVGGIRGGDGRALSRGRPAPRAGPGLDLLVNFLDAGVVQVDARPARRAGDGVAVHR